MLDIGVGRGGDILKWHNANINVVIGLDIHENLSFHICNCVILFPDQDFSELTQTIPPSHTLHQVAAALNPRPVLSSPRITFYPSV